ncbi:MAG: hydantoinase/oxoprolinase family protein [Rhodospirillaceae bacterium]|nr:hydantoinase/oxoprolinase family protein [Rhodospirillaceae bacterium]
MAARWHLGIDSGGTFTDVMAVDDAGRMRVLKVPSTPKHPPDGPLNGIAKLQSQLKGEAIADVSHGTTVGLNALLQRKFPAVGLITTRGFRHVLEIARHTVPGEWGTIYAWIKPPRVVPLENVAEVDERIDKDGAIVTALDEANMRAVADDFAAKGIVTIAVCLMHAYRNPVHEQRVRDILLAKNPKWLISLSSEVMPEFREYERMVTTATNAVLAPLLGRYFAEFGERVKQSLGPAAGVFVMRSAGGVVNAEEAAAQPLRTALSGPAAGVLGMAKAALKAGIDKVITFDMGGTSADIAAVDGGEPHLTTDAAIDIYPLRTPTIDLVTIGAGGGSLITIGTGGRIQVGPTSAGADPGPACYRKGGTEPTVTDANLVLGRIGQKLLDGDVTLDPEAARQALQQRGEKLGLSALQLAFSAIEIVCNNMAGAVRQVSIKRGLDPRVYSLVAFGGAGPLHAARMAELLGISRVLVPPYPGLGSCVGLLMADVRLDASSTFIQKENEFDAAAAAEIFQSMSTKLARRIEAHGLRASTFLLSADMRYVGMGTELNVALGAERATAANVSELFEGFHRQHQSVFGYAYRGRHLIETVALRVTAVARRGIAMPAYAFDRAQPKPLPVGERAAVMDAAMAATAVPVYRREDLPQGWSMTGPVLIDQYDSTTVIPAGHDAAVDTHGNLILTRR